MLKSRSCASSKTSRQAKHLIGKRIELDCYGFHYIVLVNRVNAEGIRGEYMSKRKDGTWGDWISAIGLFTDARLSPRKSKTNASKRKRK